MTSLLGTHAEADTNFDSVYPDWVRCLSPQHFSPVEVVQFAAAFLVEDAHTRVLDVGSGAGKFCIIGALATEGRFLGVEQQAALVEVARNAARDYGVADRAQFIHGDMVSVDWQEFDAFYLYNPFFERVSQQQGLFASRGRSPESGTELWRHHVGVTRARLAEAPIGTRVATYHGFGGDMPPGYRCVGREGRGTDFVELWCKELTSLWIPPFEGNMGSERDQSAFE